MGDGWIRFFGHGRKFQLVGLLRHAATVRLYRYTHSKHHRDRPEAPPCDVRGCARTARFGGTPRADGSSRSWAIISNGAPSWMNWRLSSSQTGHLRLSDMQRIARNCPTGSRWSPRGRRCGVARRLCEPGKIRRRAKVRPPDLREYNLRPRTTTPPGFTAVSDSRRWADKTPNRAKDRVASDQDPARVERPRPLIHVSGRRFPARRAERQMMSEKTQLVPLSHYNR